MLLATTTRKVLVPVVPCTRALSITSTRLPDGITTWKKLQNQAEQLLVQPKSQRFNLSGYLKEDVIRHDTLEGGISHLIGQKLSANENSTIEGAVHFEDALRHAFSLDKSLSDFIAADLVRFLQVDLAAKSELDVFLFYKGFQAIACARFAHCFWKEGQGEGRMMARLLQSEMADVYGVDIHPAAKLGKGVTIDHATGVVIGETARVGDNTHFMHGVTLGATGTSLDEDRHPKIGANVLLCAKCTVLGNISVGDNAVVAAAALVREAVPPGYTAVGIPPHARQLPPKVL